MASISSELSSNPLGMLRYCTVADKEVVISCSATRIIQSRTAIITDSSFQKKLRVMRSVTRIGLCLLLALDDGLRQRLATCCFLLPSEMQAQPPGQLFSSNTDLDFAKGCQRDASGFFGNDD